MQVVISSCTFCGKGQWVGSPDRGPTLFIAWRKESFVPDLANICVVDCFMCLDCMKELFKSLKRVLETDGESIKFKDELSRCAQELTY